MICKNKFDDIKKKYGNFSTWAIWNFKDEKDTSIIEQNLSKLHTNWVIIGLNISQPVDSLANFRGGKHDRKLKYAFNNTFISGSYMTDLIKSVEVKSSEILKDIKSSKIDINAQVSYFNEELKFVCVNEETKFIIFGNAAKNIYDNFYKGYYPNNEVFFLKHYSSRGTDQKWVEETWKELNINLNYETEYNKYRHTIQK